MEDETTPRQTLLVAVSGVSSSGKTTLARKLRDAWPGSILIHEDDFYLTDAEIPVKNGVQDWDCLEALDLDQLREALLYARQYGTMPEWLRSKEDQNANSAPPEPLSPWYYNTALKLVGEEPLVSIVFVDGFLLYSERMKEIRELFDVKLFLTADLQTVKSRRESRTGYVTIEGFWEDPPGYVDDVVWPNYVKEHAFLFQEGDVEGAIDADKTEELGILTMPADHERLMSLFFPWAYDRVYHATKEIIQSLPVEDSSEEEEA